MEVKDKNLGDYRAKEEKMSSGGVSLVKKGALD